MELKKCRKCKEHKELDCFSKSKKENDGHYYYCKSCNKIYRNNNSKTIKEKRLVRRIEINSYSKEYDRLNKEKRKQYNLVNKEKRKLYRKERYKNDLVFRITSIVRSMIYKSIKDNNYKKSKYTKEILGCSFEEFKFYLESKFESWMNWENQGQYNGELNYGWDIDHIVPLSSVNSEEGILKLNHFSNLQPLCSKVNRDIKFNKVN